MKENVPIESLRGDTLEDRLISYVRLFRPKTTHPGHVQMIASDECPLYKAYFFIKNDEKKFTSRSQQAYWLSENSSFSVFVFDDFVFACAVPKFLSRKKAFRGNSNFLRDELGKLIQKNKKTDIGD
jgi:hypothetical protein